MYPNQQHNPIGQKKPVETYDIPPSYQPYSNTNPITHSPMPPSAMTPQTVQGRRHKWVAVLLALFPLTGWFGLHFFYLNKSSMGVLFLLVHLVAVPIVLLLSFLCGLVFPVLWAIGVVFLLVELFFAYLACFAYGMYILSQPNAEFNQQYNAMR